MIQDEVAVAVEDHEKNSWQLLDSSYIPTIKKISVNFQIRFLRRLRKKR